MDILDKIQWRINLIRSEARGSTYGIKEGRRSSLVVWACGKAGRSPNNQRIA